MKTAKILKSLRKKSGLSMAALAESAKLSRQAVHLIENGKREPGHQTLRKLAKALGASLAAFD